MFDFSYIVDWKKFSVNFPDKARIEKETNRTFCLQLQVSGKTGTICSATFTTMVLLVRLEVSIFLWGLAMILLYAGRYVLLGRLMRRDPDKACAESTMRAVLLTVFLNGAGWGIGMGLFVWHDIPVTRLPFFLIAMGLLTISGPILSARPVSCLLFAFPLLVGTVIHLFRMEIGSVYFATTAVILCAITGFAVVMTYEMNRLLRIGIVQRLENEDFIEQMKKARAAAEDTARAKSVFLATMSHEIRNPVNGLMGMLEILKQTHPSPEQNGYIEVASKSADALLGVLNDILDYSKLEVGKLELENAPFDWMSLTGETAMMHRLLAAEKGLSFHLAFPDDAPPVVRGDPLRLRQILNNLLSNAIKFTEDGSITLTVSAAAQEDGRQKLSFSVKDTGIGMDEQAKKKLFAEYQQASASTTRKYGGTGLGLAISQQLAHLMDGEITVESEPGHGSVFTLVAYFAKSDPSELAATGTPGEKRFFAKALLVEDDPVSQRVATMMLKGFGITASVADCGKIAVDLFDKNDFDIVFVDSRLPDMDGFEAAAVMRSHKSGNGGGSRGVIVALSGACTPEDRRRAMDCGIDDFLTKPLRKRDLRLCLDRWLAPKNEAAPKA